MTYSEKLKDPRWQKKRLEIMERAQFQCQNCGSETDTLHIHHRYYERGLSPWDYPDESLECLCEKCHSAAEALSLRLRRLLGMSSSLTIAGLIGHLTASLLVANDAIESLSIRSYEEAEAAAIVLHTSPEQLIRSLDEDGNLNLDALLGTRAAEETYGLP